MEWKQFSWVWALMADEYTFGKHYEQYCPRYVIASEILVHSNTYFFVQLIFIKILYGLV